MITNKTGQALTILARQETQIRNAIYRPFLRHPVSADSSSLVAASLAGVKIATNFLVHEKIWFDKFKYDDAERRFYEQMNGPVAGASRQTSGPGASSSPSGDHSELVVRIASLEVENQSLRGMVQELQQAISKLEARLNVLEKSSPGHGPSATAPIRQLPISLEEPQVTLDCGRSNFLLGCLFCFGPL
uniref:Elongation factor 1-delta n=1 Tax=Macaca nemestrina TaxID=9545 RepID=A0A2K6DD71_MACNE